MTALKSNEIERYLKNPIKPITLIYGPDLGLVRARAETLLKSLQIDKSNPFSYLLIDGATLAEDLSRLKDEAQTLSLFGEKRFIHIKAESVNLSAALNLLNETLLSATILIEAGDLKPSHGTRSFAEKSAIMAALPCYADSYDDLKSLIETTLAKDNLSITPDAREWLISQLGADRASSLSEIEKIALYALKEKTVTSQHVEDLTIDSSKLLIDEMSDLTFCGQPQKALNAYNKGIKSDIYPGVFLSSLLRHAERLLSARLNYEQQNQLDAAILKYDARLHFKRRPLIEKSIKTLSSDKLYKEINRLSESSAQLRLTPLLAPTFLHRLILGIALRTRAR